LKVTVTFGGNRKITGKAIEFYEDGNVKSKGKYNNGFCEGQLKGCNGKNALVIIVAYDSNGVIKNNF
jgi:antitoxin component YwqK of YwqJK toxin-antitoxin module